MRALRFSLIALVVVVGLLVAADRIAVELAEDEAAGKIQHSQDLKERPEVSIRGFPFLTQAFDKKLDEVEARLTGLETDAAGTSLRVDRVDVTLHDVRLRDGLSASTAKDASGRALITYEDLTDAAPPGITLSYGGEGEGKGKLKATARVTLPLLGEREQSIYSTVRIVNKDTVRVRADEVPFADEFPELEKEVRKRTDFDRKLESLPKGLELKRVEVTKKGVEILVGGKDVRLAD